MELVMEKENKYIIYVNLINARIHSRVDSGFIESEFYIT